MRPRSGRGGPGTRPTWSRSARPVPARPRAARPARPRGHASSERAPSSRSRSGSPNTRRARRIVRTSASRTGRSGTGTSGQVSRTPHRSADPRRRSCPTSRPSTSLAGRGALFKWSCRTVSPRVPLWVPVQATDSRRRSWVVKAGELERVRLIRNSVRFEFEVWNRAGRMSSRCCRKCCDGPRVTISVTRKRSGGSGGCVIRLACSRSGRSHVRTVVNNAYSWGS